MSRKLYELVCNLGSLMSRISSTASCMQFRQNVQPVTPAHQCQFTLVFDHLTVFSYPKPPDTMMFLLSGACNISCLDRTKAIS